MLLNVQLSLIFKNNIRSWRKLKYDFKDPSTYSIAVLSSFLFFVVVQAVLLPLYLFIYLCMLMVYSTNIYNYVYSPNQLEVVPIEHFYRFSNMYLEFVYNITYRRACINSFITLYSVLKFWHTTNTRKPNILERALLFLKLIMSLSFRLLCKLITGISWFIIARSFQYSKAFRGVPKYRRFNLEMTIRGYILNSYQLQELSPGIFYRIYKMDNTCWNFNPTPAISIKGIILLNTFFITNKVSASNAVHNTNV